MPREGLCCFRECILAEMHFPAAYTDPFSGQLKSPGSEGADKLPQLGP